jgi:hypothetical protein
VREKLRNVRNKSNKYLLEKLVTLFENATRTYYTIISRPKHSEKVVPSQQEVLHYPKTAILLQGPLMHEDDFTLETVKLYRKLHSSAYIIVSTWKNENEQVLEKLKSLGAYVVISKIPGNRGPRNINMQIVSTYAGIKEAERLGVPYILKSRTDQRFYATNIIPFLLALLKTFPFTEKNVKQKERIVVCSHETLKYRLYGATDQFQFGTLEDMLTYWGAPLDDREPGVGKNDITLRDFAKSRLTETYMESSFLERIGVELTWTLEDSWNMYRNYFIVVDKRTVDLYWPKYEHYKEERLDSYMAKTTDYMTFREWLLLYGNKDINAPESILDVPFRSAIPHGR